jgi:hypothetical protein
MSLADTAFSRSSYDAVVAKLSTCQTDMQHLLTLMPGAIASVQSSPVLAYWSPYLVSIISGIEQVVRDVIDFIGKLFEGIEMPIHFALKSGRWKDEVGSPLSGIAAAIDPANLSLPHSFDWTGAASDNYADRIASQTKAAAAIAKKANGLGDVLAISAGAGLALYIGIGVAVITFFAEQIVAFLADLTGIGAIAGLPVAGISAGKVVAIIAALVLAGGAFTAQMINQMSTLKGLDQADGIFPNGTEWPSATS